MQRCLLLSFHLFAPFAASQCGNVTVKLSNSLIVGSNAVDSHPGEWPWLVPIFNGSLSMYKCGSSLISEWFLLTAAHCIPNGDIKNLFVLPGRYKLNDDKDPNSVKRTIAKAFIHESYNPQAKAFRSHCDISVLRMNDFVRFTPYIQPVCLPVKNSNTNGIIGTSVGFGYHSGIKGFQNTPKQAVMSSISFSDCLFVHLDYALIVSKQSFCARGQDASPCNGDSGGGYYVLNPRTLQYTTYGVVSSTFKGCSTMDYTVFVDVAQHVDWVNESE
jgi:secreted trypsin-like serine protease